MANSYSWNMVLTHTFMNFRKVMEDNITKMNSVLSALNMHGAVERRGGGEGYGGGALVLPVLKSLNSSFKYLGGKFDTIDVDYQDGGDAVEFDFSNMVCPIVVSWIEQINNRGTAKIMDLIRDKARQTELTMSTNIEKGITGYALQTDSTANAMIGLENLCWPYASTVALTDETGTSVTPTSTWNTFGGKLASTDTWWKNQYREEATTTANIEDELRELWLDCQAEGGGGPDIAIADKTAFTALAAREFGMRQYNVTGKVGKPGMADLGHPTLAFMNATVVWSPYVVNTESSTYGIIYLLNSKFTKLYIDPSSDMKLFPFTGPKGDSNQLISQALYVHRCVLGTSNRRTNGVLFNIGQ